MRTLLAFVPAFLLAACAGTAPTGPLRTGAPQAADGFDARAWMERHWIVWDTTAWEQVDYADMHRHAREAAVELDSAIGLVAPCELTEDDIANPEHAWGSLNRTALGPDEYLVEVGCEFYAYQGTFVLVHIASTRAALVTAPQYDVNGGPFVTAPRFLGFNEPDSTRHGFSVFAKARGMSDCGTYSTYQLGDVGMPATVVTVRSRTCPEEPTDDIPAPSEWPVVYPAP